MKATVGGRSRFVRTGMFRTRSILAGRVLVRPVLVGWAARGFAATVGAVLLAACSQGVPAPQAGANEAAVAAASQDTYVIGPGDSLSVFVYHNPDLTAEVPVRPDGKISVPLLQDVVAAGKTPSQLAGEITEELRKYVREPTVTVIVRQFIGPYDRQVRVIGEATDPQAIAYREHMTLLDVMIATRGLTRYADGNGAKIIRTFGATGGKQSVFNVRLADLVRDGDVTQNVEMLPGDTLIIPQTWY